MATAFQSFSISLDQGSQKYHFKPFIRCAKKEIPQRVNAGGKVYHQGGAIVYLLMPKEEAD